MFNEVTPFLRGKMDATSNGGKNKNPFTKGCQAHDEYEQGFNKIKNDAFEKAALELEYMCRGLAAHDIPVVQKAVSRIRSLKTQNKWKKSDAPDLCPSA